MINFSVIISLFKVNNRNNRQSFSACSKLTKRTVERYQWRRFTVFIVSIFDSFFLLFLLLSLSMCLLEYWGLLCWWWGNGTNSNSFAVCSTYLNLLQYLIKSTNFAETNKLKVFLLWTKLSGAKKRSNSIHITLLNDLNIRLI